MARLTFTVLACSLTTLCSASTNNKQSKDGVREPMAYILVLAMPHNALW